MRMIKTTAEAIMESLRLLLVILMSQLEVRAPDQEIATDHAQVLSNLLNEVQSQKGRIEQPSKMLQGRTLSCRCRFTPEGQEPWVQQKFRSWRPIGRIVGSGGSRDGSDGRHPTAEHGDQCQCQDESTSQDAQVSTTNDELSGKNPSSRRGDSSPLAESDCPDRSGLGGMEQQEGVVGKDPQWILIRRSVRAISKPRDLDFCKGRHGQRRDARFHHVCPSPGTSSSESPCMKSISEGPAYDELLVENEDEFKWLLNCIHHMPQRTRRIDLLEVYTEPNSVLKEARDFNQTVSIDGFEWKSQTGYQGYVIHIIDEATQFHLGHRSCRDTASIWKVFSEQWQAWAGTPQEVMMDRGGELISDEMKNL
eukprot:s4711_g2.t1